MMRVALVGATGNVGRQIAALLLQRQVVGPEQLEFYASPGSAGTICSVEGQDFKVQAATPECFQGKTLAIFATESDVSARLVPEALKAGNYVVDSSSHYRLEAGVPLIIPPVNLDQVCLGQKLYAHANCLASPLSTVLAPIARRFSIIRAQVTTYQSTSGAGYAAMQACLAETQHYLAGKEYAQDAFPRPIAFNVIPQVGPFLETGETFEEYKIQEEVKKVLGSDLRITATAVRVPVMVGHSMAVTVELGSPFTLKEVQEALEEAPFVTLSPEEYHTPREAVGSDQVFVGRLRRDLSLSHGLHLWTCSDNLRRGAATDAVEIAQRILGFPLF